MNDLRREKRRRALRRVQAGATAGAVVCIAGAVAGAPLLGLAAGAGLVACGSWLGWVAHTGLPPMLRQHRKEHRELLAAARRLAADLRVLPDLGDQILDLVEIDAAMRSRASASIERIRRLHDQAAAEGRLGVVDRIKGGLRTVASADPMTELQYVIETVRSLLDREIDDLERSRLSDPDRVVQRERESTLAVLRVQREVFDSQCQTLRRCTESCRTIRESVRTAELQASNVSNLDLDELRRLAGGLARTLTQDVGALERALVELSGPGERGERSSMPSGGV
jgi:hypothetical protein